MPHLSREPVSLSLVPGRSLGMFMLGDSLWHVLDLLRTNKASFPKIEIQWDIESPSTSPIIIRLPHLILTFPCTSLPSAQLLQTITIPDLPSATSQSGGITLTYKANTLASPPPFDPSPAPEKVRGQHLTRGMVARVFGPTFDRSGDADVDDDMIYPGIGFTFIKSERGFSQDNYREWGVESVVIFQSGKEGGKDADRQRMKMDWGVEVDMEPTEVMDGMVRSCEIQPGQGITLHFYVPPSEPPSTLTIRLNETLAQDLLCDLGPPLRKYLKEDNRISDVWAGGAGGQIGDWDESRGSGCWWNYFQHGLDFLIDDEGSGLVKKIMIHSNIPGSALFQRHARCPWTIKSSNSHELLTFTASMQEIAANLPAAAQGKDFGDAHHPSTMSLDRTGEGNLVDVVGIAPSKLMALDGLVLEETDKGGIASVLVFPRDAR